MLGSVRTNMKLLLRLKSGLPTGHSALFTCAFHRQQQKSEIVKRDVKPIKVDPKYHKDEFLPIFKFPYIVMAQVVCRMKLYQTGLTFCLIPVYRILYALDIVNSDQVKLSFLICGFACAILYVMGSFFRRLVGFLYINRAKDTIKVAHLTFWGSRRDAILPLTEVMTFAETGGNPNNVYHSLKTYSGGEHYYYIIRYGGILQPELFQEVFGEHSM